LSATRATGSSGTGDGRAIMLQGVTYSKGLGVHAPSEIIFSLNGNYDQFISDVGVDDEEVNVGSVTFQVWADTVKVYDSGDLDANSAIKTVNISVVGVQKLKLIVTDAGDGTDFDHADWASARLVKNSSTVVAPGAPTNLAGSASGTTANLAWTAATGTIGGYTVERSDTAAFTTVTVVATLPGTTLSYADTGRTPGTSPITIASRRSTAPDPRRRRTRRSSRSHRSSRLRQQA
jgi:hypothetical protein